MLCVSALYPDDGSGRFDAAYYLGPHTDLANRLLKPAGLIAIRATIGEHSLDGSRPPFFAISELHFTDRATFDAAIAAHGAEVSADVANYTNVSPILQVSTIAGLAD